MTDLPQDSWASSPAVRRSMQANRGRDTKPELVLRSACHALGLRFRVDHPLPLDGVRRRGDLVFPRARVAVFLDSCFWHSCPQHATRPKTNATFWEAKLARTVERDAETNRLLAEVGWAVIRVWEHEDLSEAAADVAEVVRASGSGNGSVPDIGVHDAYRAHSAGCTCAWSTQQLATVPTTNPCPGARSCSGTAE